MKRVNPKNVVLLALMIMPLMSYGQTEDGSFVFQNFTLSDFGDGYDKAQSLVWKPSFSEFVAQVPNENGQESTDTTGATDNQQNDKVIVRGGNPDPKRSAVRYTEAKPDGVTDIVAGVQKYVLGVKAQFTQQGYNWIELRPNRLDTAGAADTTPPAAVNTDTEVSTVPDINAKSTPYKIPFKGKAIDLSLWVWGGQYGWWIEVYTRDYLNYQYRFPLGDLLYSGWKQKRTSIPNSVVQDRKRQPASQPLTFEMIKLWSFPSESVDQFYVYFDLLQHGSVVSTEIFNGESLADDLW